MSVLSDMMSAMNRDIIPGDAPSRPDFAEKRLAMAMIRDVIGELDDYARGATYYRMPKKQQVMQDAISWINGKTECSLTFAMVCELLGWHPDYVGPELLKVAAGTKPTIKKQYKERGNMAPRLGPNMMKGGKVVPRGHKGRPAKAENLDGLGVTSQVWERGNV